MATLTNFLPSIDNLATNVKDVHSLMIVPIYGHKTRMVPTAGGGVQEGIAIEGARSKPIAIL